MAGSLCGRNHATQEKETGVLALGTLSSFNLYKRRFAPAVYVGACLWMGGCQYNPPYVDDFTQVMPNKAQLVGTYVLTDETMVHSDALINGDPYHVGSVSTANDGSKASVHKLILRGDGTFTAVNVPFWTGGFSTEWSIKNFQSGAGKWDVEDGGVSFVSSKVKLIPNDNITSPSLAQRLSFR